MWFSASGPASLSNLGPGFDTLGLCITNYADTIRLKLTAKKKEFKISIPNNPLEISTTPEQNTAAVAAMYVLKMANYAGGFEMVIEKGMRAGTGIGSSAASAVAGAWVANKALGTPFSKQEIVRACLEGEFAASGGYHGDNVMPALFGNLVLVSAKDPERYRVMPISRGLRIVLMQPYFQILTKQAREILPKTVDLWDAVRNASELAFMLDAFQHGDWESVGQSIMKDAIIEPVRAKLLPCYSELKQRCLDNGAYGCALSGSGPAMFSIAPDKETAEQILKAVQKENQCNIAVEAQIVTVNQTGVE